MAAESLWQKTRRGAYVCLKRFFIIIKFWQVCLLVASSGKENIHERADQEFKTTQLHFFPHEHVHRKKYILFWTLFYEQTPERLFMLHNFRVCIEMFCISFWLINNLNQRRIISLKQFSPSFARKTGTP